MQAATTNWSVTLNDDIFQPISYLNEAGEPYDFSQWRNFRSQIRSNPTDRQPEGVFIAEFRDEDIIRAVNGIITFILPKDRYQPIEGTHRFDVEATNINSRIGDQTLIKGNVTFSKDVTKTS